MSAVAVYIGRSSEKNFRVGLRNSVWGWKRTTADRAETPEVLAGLKAGDYILFGHRGPSVRVGPGGWADAVLRELAIARVTGPRYVSDTPVWEDDTYPVRVPMEVLGVEERFDGRFFGAELMEALRLSANKQSSPVPVSDLEVMAGLVNSLNRLENDEARDAPTPPGASDSAAALGPVDIVPPPRFLDLDDDLDRLTTAIARREQTGLRRRMFNGSPSARCDLCGRTLPSRLVRAAHVRKRSECDADQRRDTANLMAACVLGCDALFEDRFIHVTAEGLVALSQETLASEDLASAAGFLDGRRCTAHTSDSEPYFAWHRRDPAGPRGDGLAPAPEAPRAG
ncbi:hypothetical protein ACPC54_20320 [Kitasatospora sp. NPDC094028]